MTVLAVRVSSTTTTGAIVACEVDSTAAVRVAVSTNSALTSPVYYGPVTPVGYTVYYTPSTITEYTAKIEITGLTPGTRYYYAIEHNATLNTVLSGQFPTLPEQPDSFTFGTIGDAGLSPDTPGEGSVLAENRLSNHVVLDTIRGRAVAENWVGVFTLGDECYYDLGAATGHGNIPDGAFAETAPVNRRMFSDLRRQSRRHALYRNAPYWWTPDDHDRAFNDHNRTAGNGPVWEQVYRERWPVRDLPSSTAVYQSLRVGDAIILISDSRSARDPNGDPDVPGKTMLGAEQKAWILQELANTTAKVAIWLMPSQWLRTEGSDTWASFTYERDEMSRLINEAGWGHRLVMVNADRHCIKTTDVNTWGGWPVMVSAPIDASSGPGTTDYPDGLPDDPGDSHSQYGTVTVTKTDLGHVVTMRTWRGTTQIGEVSLTVEASAPEPASDRSAVARLISGSHQIAVEARVLTEYQDGPDPVGVDIPITMGDVQLDGTADMYGTLQLETVGDWPRRARDLLSPFGNEIFVRRGIVVGDDIMWVPLGYYRIQEPTQADASDGPITVTGLDRMAGIIEARLLAPREFEATSTIGAVVSDLVHEIYPLARIQWDDDTPYTLLGRTVASEESRYDMLREIADSRGKLMYWDTEGVLRFESPPDPRTPVWEVAAGSNGVLVSASRRLTRDGVYNALVVTGEGADDSEEPVRAVAYDNNDRSPTYFYGRFGQVPKYYSSPLIQTVPQAQQAARSMLARNLGFPYSVTFTAVPNPALRPWDPIRVTTRDGTRELHVVSRTTIPLDAAAIQTASTKEQTLVVIGDTA